MEMTAYKLFASHVDPMWIFDRKTLRFLAVNNAAVAKYGYSSAEFLAMTIADIRPDDDRAKLKEKVAVAEPGLEDAGVWRHRLKSGDVIYVSITVHSIEHEGRSAALFAARDVSELVIAEKTAQEALGRERAARRASEMLARQFQIMFDAVPGMFLVVSPDGFDTIAVSDAYLGVIGAGRADTVGRNLFDVLPRQADDPIHLKLRQSFDRVLATGEPDLLDVQSVQTKHSDAGKGVDARLWAMSTSPVKAPDGKLLYLMLRVQDVTEAVTLVGASPAPKLFSAPQRVNLDLLAHTHGLHSENARLTELAIRLRTTQRLLETGTWDYVIDTDHLEWSSNVYEMYGVSTESFKNRFEDYVALIHPDDRAALYANYATFMASDEDFFTFDHRICHSDGNVVHVKGVAERTETAQGVMLRGVVQNVTKIVEASRALSQTKRLLEIACSTAAFGAWRYDALAEKLVWSNQTARIHDEPEGFSPNVAGGIAYYVKEYRSRIRNHFKKCLAHGIPFSDVLEIVTAKGRRLWVRATGEAERDDTGRIVAVNGSFQDVTELTTIRKRAEEAESLLKIAGKAVRLGGWRVTLADKQVYWTDGIASIHEEPIGTTPEFEESINYFAAEDRLDALRVFDACAKHGTPFDNLRTIITANGHRLTVRSIGEAVKDKKGTVIAVQGAMQDVSELIAAHQKADELRIGLAETLENMGDAFFILDSEFKFTYLNRRCEHIIQQSRDNLIGKTLSESFPALIGTTASIKYAHALETGETVRFEETVEPTGRAFRVVAHPTKTGLAVYFTEATEERRTQERLRLLDTAVAHINDVVIITQADAKNSPHSSKIVYVNGAFEKQTGYQSGEVIGKTPRMLQGPKTQRSELNRIKQALSHNAPVRAELVNYSKTGGEYTIELDISPVTNDAGTVSHFVAVQRDNTQRRQNEEALRLSETRFRLIAESTASAIWEWDIAKGRQWWSEGLKTIFGHQPDPEGKLPTVWRANVHQDDADRINATLNRLVSGKSDKLRERYRFRRANGTWTTVEDQAFVIANENGKSARVLGIMSDISDRLVTEERLRQSERLEAVGQITGGVAHDFNNLLTVIMGSTEFLQERLDADHPLRHYVDMGALAAERAAELTSRLLSFSRKQALDPRVTDVNETIAGLEGMLVRTLGENINTQIIKAEGLWQTEIDQGQLEVALLNLAVNSRDAMPASGALTIETANASLDDAYVAAEPGIAAGDYVVIAVSDNGHGISSDQIDRVFEPFFTTKPVGKGTGLGLSMVYGFVKQSGGHIRIYSEMNEGTTVRLYFPRKDGLREVRVLETEYIGPLRGNETILVVEDDPLILQQLILQLKRLGYNVITADSGPPALAVLRERSDIDLLFTDVVLPGGMNGRQIAEAARALHPDLKILYTSGYSENAIVHHGRLDQGVELLSKPYGGSELALKVRKVLDRH